MTTPKSTLRPRRRTTVENLPRDLAAWFAGELRPATQSGAPWSALIWPDYALVPDRWQVWKASHPDARPPVGWEWLDDPTSPNQPAEWLLELARKVAARPLQRRP